jgi:hypothetical protein
MIRSILIDPSKETRRPDIQLQAKYMDAGVTACQIVADRDHLCLLVPFGGETGYRIWVFQAKDGKELRSIPLPENRALQQNACENLRIADGVLYVYNVLKTGRGSSPAGFLTAFRIGTPDAGALLAWDAVAPALQNNQGVGYRVEPGLGNFVLFSATRGAAPRESAEGPIAAVYSQQKGGYLKMLFAELTPVPEIDPVVFWRGRLYVNTRTGLQIYGNPW